VNFAGLPIDRPGINLLDRSGTMLASGLQGQGLFYQSQVYGDYYLQVIDNSALGQMVVSNLVDVRL
jgi:hypothetical protein